MPIQLVLLLLVKAYANSERYTLDAIMLLIIELVRNI